MHGLLLIRMVGPQKRRQHIDIEQVNSHGKSLNASFTLRAVILGDPFGGSKTTRPFTSRTGVTSKKAESLRSRPALLQRKRNH